MDMTSKYAAAHSSTNGPGDSRPTALEIVKDENLEGKLVGKVFVITGCSSGIGIDTARALSATGAKLFLTARDVTKGKEALADILEPGRVELLGLDLSSLDSVRQCAREILEKTKTLNILINNAGVMMTPKGKTVDGFETQFGTNHLGHFLLFNLLRPALLASSTPEFHSRVVNVSSTAHRVTTLDFDDINWEKRPYHPHQAYGQGKLANVYMANEIERRYGREGLHGLSLHPGGIVTGLQRHVDAATVASWDNDFVRSILKSPAQGAATTVWAALSHGLEGRGGLYLENCAESQPVKGDYLPLHPGYEPHAFNQESEERLWAISLEMVGLEDDH
jgi:NAD(P)-dependent dehydrogenase (short-subunit alcohol dehydrogenase family)